jgi:hypothetical protein
MTRSINGVFAAALLAASAFGASAAFASGGDGDYYQGVYPRAVEQMNVDAYATQSVSAMPMTNDAAETTPGDGEYFRGAAEQK